MDDNKYGNKILNQLKLMIYDWNQPSPRSVKSKNWYLNDLGLTGLGLIGLKGSGFGFWKLM